MPGLPGLRRDTRHWREQFARAVVEETLVQLDSTWSMPNGRWGYVALRAVAAASALTASIIGAPKASCRRKDQTESPRWRWSISPATASFAKSISVRKGSNSEAGGSVDALRFATFRDCVSLRSGRGA